MFLKTSETGRGSTSIWTGASRPCTHPYIEMPTRDCTLPVSCIICREALAAAQCKRWHLHCEG